MIDFVQYLNYSFDYLKFVEVFNPKMYAEIKTGVLKLPIIHEDGPLIFSISISSETNEYYLKMKGSIHKYWNYINGQYGPKGKGHNYNFFGFQDLKNTLKHIETKYCLDLSEGYLNTLEVGLNIPTKIKSENIVNQYLYLFKEIAHGKYTNGKLSSFKEFITANFNIKIYSKSLQYGLEKSILRFEIKHKNHRQIKRFNITTLNDLLHGSVWNLLFVHLEKQFDDTLIIDPYNYKNANRKDLELYSIFTSQQELSKQRKRITRAGIKKRKSKFDEFLNNYNLLEVKNEIDTSIKSLKDKLVNDYHEHL